MNPKHIILTLLLMLCPIGMAAQSTITRHKPKPAVTKPKPAAKPKAKPKPAPRRNSTHHSGSTSSTVSLSTELNKLINNMVYVSGGTFTMGGTSEQGSDAYDDEKPTHSVTLSSYYICKYEVTQALWRAVMGNNPSNFKGDNLPVECVSRDDCQTFINRLNSYTGRNFRLPTEAEWEFAARGGNYSRHYKYSGSNYISDVAWYDGNSSNRTHPVGTKQANELGLYDMSGNVWEWCSDWYGSYSSYSQNDPTGPNSGSHRVNRGGCWISIASYCRSSRRSGSTPGSRVYGLGLRLVLSQL
ncbi:formylglycine-generating enzyme family protein [Prevotellamassilia timonensis]|uniref:formylglycine-generating enzyme family protein n=1 Tax=Prevotellamassilia timonensis TaxID=1852370 RepID=UPI0023F4E462|nr:formylglycine-generating enzyme family protein [Prevotellamassilia timonensis]MDD7439841.1 formylglycine-generating enzyme family protein [Prevotellamassilia timonensis]